MILHCAVSLSFISRHMAKTQLPSRRQADSLGRMAMVVANCSLGNDSGTSSAPSILPPGSISWSLEQLAMAKG